jgi:hypothetical protein
MMWIVARGGIGIFRTRLHKTKQKKENDCRKHSLLNALPGTGRGTGTGLLRREKVLARVVVLVVGRVGVG